MRLIRPGTPRPGLGFNASVGCDLSALAHGIPMKGVRRRAEEEGGAIPVGLSC